MQRVSLRLWVEKLHMTKKGRVVATAVRRQEVVRVVYLIYPHVLKTGPGLSSSLDGAGMDQLAGCRVHRQLGELQRQLSKLNHQLRA